MFVCRKCKQSKPLTEFHKNKERLGHCHTCRGCVKIYQQTSEKYKKRRAEYRKEHHEQNIAYARKYRDSEKGKIAISRGRTKHKAIYRSKPENRLKLMARQAIHWGVFIGAIIKPSACEKCQSPCFPHAHHYAGYEKENWLKVEWLCKSCHGKAHRNY